MENEQKSPTKRAGPVQKSARRAPGEGGQDGLSAALRRLEGALDDCHLTIQHACHVEAYGPTRAGSLTLLTASRELGEPQRREPPDPRLLERPDGFGRQPEGGRRTGLNLAEDVHPAAPEDDVQLAVPARPVAG